MTAVSLTSETETAARIAHVLRSAAADRKPLRIRGGGHWLEAGAPVAAQEAVSLHDDAGIVEYVPGDLTLTALAGTPLSQINAAAAAERQWLPLDPFGSASGTIGATVATASFGPLAQMFGTPRDQLLGVEFVSGAGDIIRGGGRVTKNVAGFDLARMTCGAWGTLGVITEVTLRLRAMPDRDVTYAVPVGAELSQIVQLLAKLRQANVAPAAMELIDSAMCKSLSVEQDRSDHPALLLRFCGNEAGVNAQTSRLNALAPTREYPASIWKLFTASDSQRGGAGAIVLRLSSRPSKLAENWRFATEMTRNFGGSFVHATVGRGIVRCSIPARWQESLSGALGARPDGSLIFEKLPAPLWPLLAPPDVLSHKLSVRLRNAFDPQHILNRGILGEAPA